MSKTSFRDLIGQKLGKLTVIKRAPSDKRGQTMWECRCVCGVIKIVRASSLIGGITKSCGAGTCRDWYSNVIDMAGMRFGRLFVESRAIGDNGTMWNCICDCGNTKVVDYNSLVKGTTTSCGCFRKELNHKLGEALRDHSPATKMREVYIQNFGKIPEGMYVTDLDWDMKNSDSSYLALISKRALPCVFP